MIPSASQARPIGSGEGFLKLAGGRSSAAWALFIAAAAITGLVAFAYNSTLSSRRSTLAAEMDNMANVSLPLSQHIHRVMFGADLLLSALQEDVERNGVRSAEAMQRYMMGRATYQRMQDMLVLATDVEALAFADVAGQVVTSRAWPSEKVSVAERDYFLALRGGRSQFVSAPLKSRLTGQEIVILARRVESAQGGFLGITYAVISTNRFNKLFADMLQESDTQIVLFRRDGLVMANEPQTGNAPALGAGLWGMAGPVVARVDQAKLYSKDLAGTSGEHRLVALHNVSGYPLTVAVTRSESEVLSQWQDSARLIWLFTAGFSLLVLLATDAFFRLFRARTALADTAAQLAASNQAKESVNQRLTETQEYAHIGQWELNIAQNQLSWSDQMYRVFELGRTSFSLTPDAVLALLQPEDRAAVVGARTRSLQTRTPYQVTFRLQMADGRIKHLIERGHTDYDAAGQPLYSRGSVQDITELKVVEERLREASNAAEAASRAKSEFLANMSHELRTPLNSIIGFSEMLKDGVLGELEAKQHAFTADIFDAGTHLLSLINDILDLSKVEAGALTLEPEPVDVAVVLKASTLVVRERAITHRIRLDTEIDPALGIMLTDERKLKQIVYNLLANAVKFTPDGGTVSMRARLCSRAEVALPEAPPGRLLALPPSECDDFLALSVEDTGVGIAQDQLFRLFEPFTQVDDPATRRHGGTGLGLSLVRRLAGLHGGTVGVSSQPGAGSRFCVWLPYSAAPSLVPERPVPAAARALSASGVPLALVIEDDDRMAAQISAQLQAEGFQVMRAATAEEGLVRATKHRPQLVTLDIFLPAMDGWEFLRRLKLEPALVDTPVVIITVSKDMDRGLALGARRVLHKPFAREELAATLAGLVDVRSGGEPARVLVVDDNVQAVELVATALESDGYRVLRAYGGAEAIEAARSAQPDLVILDVIMPQVSGFDVAAALRESEHTSRIPILVLTAKDLSAEEHTRLNDNVRAILMKASFSTQALLAELRRALPRH